MGKEVYSTFERDILKWGCLRRNPQYIHCYNTHKDYGEFEATSLLNPTLSAEDLKKILGGFNMDTFYRKNKHLDKRLGGGHSNIHSILNKNKHYQKILDESAKIRAFLDVINSEHRSFYDYPVSFNKQKIIWVISSYRGKKTIAFADFDLDKLKVKSSKQLYAALRRKARRLIYDKKIARKLVPKTIEVRINLSYRKAEIMKAFEREIDRWIEVLKYLGLRTKKRQVDYRIIRRYLKIYDMRNQKPSLTYEQIAEKVYPSTMEKNQDSAIQQVKREYKRAKELIYGGYKEIK